ncbi:glycoside hydrolase 5 family protein [Paenibacillus mucilaginosus]|uniref:Endo-beta-mannanase-like protein n=1 Tax=Paenibacillus mucilaginosus (strain KNP414) TaxID=1036673 RepID=F8FQJ6_PAEMK|nr:endo-beta-mannanase [Paenibacillus mucilaginosus]AEI40351.1 Endo-beta-mannanase-like protein [Paenibacillus mucilaginosus KNP414]MCG7213291.1 beta-mannanase [Paenibacillus mucilaginosus]WDM29552.1 beta-mannanase [Paenibacillus mucilaginosus]
MQQKLFPLSSPFFIGTNYWASHAGTAMWSDWRPEVVEQDLQRLSEAGLEVLRVFPLWPDFQPIDQLYGGSGQPMGYRHGEQRLSDDAAGRAGVSTLMMGRFAEFLAIASKHGFKVIVGLITGWMSGRLFVPNALKGKSILTDPDAIRWQIRFVKYFISQTRSEESIIAWDLGNECNCMGEVASREEAWMWTSSISNAIKSTDSTRPLISGMHSLTPTGKWTMQDQGELTDILTTHPYPFWTPYLDYDPINTVRPILHATAESLFYGQIGEKPCFAEEQGTMGPMVCSEQVAAAFGRASMLTQWAHGLPGLLWWCANDQTKLMTAPYDWVACEGELGLMTEEGRVKPVLQELGRLKRMIAELPFGELPERTVEAVCILNSGQDHWAAALGSFLLAKQAGFDLNFQFEDQPIRDSELYLLPCVSGVNGVPKQRWEELLHKVREGAALYISVEDGYLLNFVELTGLTVENRSRRAKETEVSFEGAVGEVRIPLASPFRLEYRADQAEVLGRETADGNVAFSKASYGKGTVYFFSLPVELEMTRRAETAYRPDEIPYWSVYELISREQRSKRATAALDPFVGVTEHKMGEHTIVAVLINYSPDARTTELTVREDWTLEKAYYGAFPESAGSGTYKVALPPNEAIVLELGRQ